ncbi:Putative L-ascorbate peroxidase 6 [Coccomyxa sp. Obi]|nr:Putative L-ascorbate peroxidase 6 [Coccomyxa sp. Obi]
MSQEPSPGVKADSTVTRRQAHISVLALVASTTAGQAQAQIGRPLEGPVKDAVLKAFKQTAEKSKAPVLLRLAFHDAATHRVSQGDGGANASIQFEFERPENTGLKRGWRVIEKVMERLKGTPAEGVVSYADLIALGGTYAVAVTGGPVIDIPIGRRDTAVPDPTGRLPEETLSAEALRLHFAAMGMSPQELVALSGAHTLGSKGYGDPVTFDNVYYTALLKKPWDDPSNNMASMIGLPSDHVLPDDPECRPVIEAYAASQQKFFQDFGTAYAKLTMLGAQWM